MKITKILCAALMIGALASCSKDDPKQPVTKSFTDETGLTLTVNNAPMIGKTVAYAADADRTTATLTVSSQFDLSLIPGIEGEGNVIAGPGALPGSKELVLSVALTDGENNQSLFSGSSETQYCTFNYNGEVTDNTLTLNFTDVRLKNLSIAGDWKTLPFSINEDTGSPNYGAPLTNPIHIVWKSESGINLFGQPVPPESLLSIVMVMPLINDNKLTAPQALNEALRGVSFTESGDVIAKIKEDLANVDAPVITSPANLAQYVLTSDNSMLFYLNPLAIAAADATKTRADLNLDLNNILGNAIAQLAPMLVDGVPMKVDKDGDNLTIYLDKEVLLPLLKQASVLLKDEAVVDALVQLISADPNMGMFAAFLPDILKSIPDVIDNTTELQIGINLVK